MKSLNKTRTFGKISFILTLFVFFLNVPDVKGQIDPELKIRSTYLAAEEAYDAGNFALAIEKLDQAKNALGGSNPKIQYLLVKSLVKIKDYEKAYKELDVYFKSSPDENSEKFLEMTKLISFLEEKIAATKKVQLFLENLKLVAEREWEACGNPEYIKMQWDNGIIYWGKGGKEVYMEYIELYPSTYVIPDYTRYNVFAVKEGVVLYKYYFSIIGGKRKGTFYKSDDNDWELREIIESFSSIFLMNYSLPSYLLHESNEVLMEERQNQVILRHVYKYNENPEIFYISQGRITDYTGPGYDGYVDFKFETYSSGCPSLLPIKVNGKFPSFIISDRYSQFRYNVKVQYTTYKTRPHNKFDTPNLNNIELLPEAIRRANPY